MLDLNELRAAFADHLSADHLRFSIDRALAHVCQIAYQRGLEDGAKGNRCRHCGGAMKPGIAIQQTVSGAPDFPGAEAVTVSPGGTGRLIDCIKCEACGWSVTAP